MAEFTQELMTKVSDMVREIEDLPWSCLLDTFSKRFVYLAAGRGDLSLVQFAIHNGVEWTREATWNATKNGYLHVLRWIHGTQPFPPADLTDILMVAVTGNHIRIIPWVVRELQGLLVPWDPRCVLKALYHGNLPLVEWFLKQGCPWPQNALEWVSQTCPELKHVMDFVRLKCQSEECSK